MPKISFRIPVELAEQINYLSADLRITESEACRLLLHRGLGASSAEQMTQQLTEAHALIRALANEITLMSSLLEEFSQRAVPPEKRSDYREMIRKRKAVADQELQNLASQYLEELNGHA
jgi:hypothetical protein